MQQEHVKFSRHFYCLFPSAHFINFELSIRLQPNTSQITENSYNSLLISKFEKTPFNTISGKKTNFTTKHKKTVPYTRKALDLPSARALKDALKLFVLEKRQIKMFVGNETNPVPIEYSNWKRQSKAPLNLALFQT